MAATSAAASSKPWPSTSPDVSGHSRFPDLSRFARVARPDEHGEIRIEPRQIYILPTRAGGVFVVLLGAILAGSINFANNLGYLLTFFLTGLGLVAMVHTWWNLLGLRLRGADCEAVFPGAEARFGILLRNPRGSERPMLEIGPARRPASVSSDVPAGGEALIHLRRPAARRGWLALGRLTIASRFPLGLFRAWSYIETGQQCLIYPAPADHPPRFSGADASDGEQPRPRPGEDDFSGHRDYHPGDPVKHIDWKILARERGLMIREFSDDQRKSQTYDFDALPGLDSEQRLRLLCRAVLDADAAGVHWKLLLPGEEIGSETGATHRARCLRALALFGETDDQGAE